ncbi:NUDIX domain-containing protein [Paenibacillus sp. GCM10012303]|uniref:NUDIX domain-containing protein n=1 Tax=Paenibacillus sp. GCM10012303 TaxID=3317340 RepID=UPI003614CFCD
MKLRQLASAFLFRGDQVLLMNKPASKWQGRSEPFYAAIGGHMEPDELNDPLAACYREIEEETGLRREEIYQMRLRYILMRQKEAEIRVQYVYTGEVMRTELTTSEEGQPKWQNMNEVPPLLTSVFLQAVWQHLMTEGCLHKERVYTGTMAVDHTGRPLVHWNELIDPLVF